jgi:nicotinamidase/pyrazinamidase
MLTPCIFLDIDTQVDFIDPKGVLPVKDASEIRENLKRLTKQALKRKIPVLSSVETHPRIDSPKGIALGEAGAKGKKKIRETMVPGARVVPMEKAKLNYPALLKKYRQIVLEKQNFNLFSNPHFLKFLKESGAKNFIVYGVAMDYGIEIATLELLKRNFKVYVVVDAVKPINETNREPVMKELHAKGAEMWNTDFIIQNT